jgi:hypothetical protein
VEKEVKIQETEQSTVHCCETMKCTEFSSDESINIGLDKYSIDPSREVSVAIHKLGAVLGTTLGKELGLTEGSMLGVPLGIPEGTADRRLEGGPDGSDKGTEVGNVVGNLLA